VRAPTRPLPTTLSSLLGAALVLVLLAGCSGAGTATGTDGATTPLLSEVTTLSNPGSATGPATARIDAAGVSPITTGTQQLPVTLLDNQGTEVTIASTDRILALDLYGSLSRVVFELGLGDNIVGRDVSSDFAEIADRPLVTQNGHDLNAEAILGLAPTLIITDSSLGPWDTVLQMRDAGIPVVVVDSKRSIASIPTLVDQIAAAVGLPERGVELRDRLAASIDGTITQIAAVAPTEPADKLRMVFLYVRGQAGVYYMFGEGSGADDLITSLGGVDVAEEIGWQGMRPLTDEGLVAAAPDVVLMMTGGLESVGGVDGLLEHVPALAQTPAGENQRIVDMSDTQILSFGPDTPRTLEALAVAIYAPDSTR
jgi:iron complex transport system substrate-binding protein